MLRVGRRRWRPQEAGFEPPVPPALLLVDTFTALEKQITELDAEINRRSKADPTARRLMTIPGVGPIGSMIGVYSAKTSRIWREIAL